MMTGLIKVDTDKAASAAASIAQLNQAIKDNFTPAKEAVELLTGSWEGSACENAKNVFYAIEEVYLNSRYQEIDQYVCFLRRYIDSGYTETESANIALADNFK